MTRKTVISLTIIAGLFLGWLAVKVVSNFNATIINTEATE